MALNIHMAGSEASIRTSAANLAAMGAAVTEAAGVPRQAASSSQASWGGQAGDAFRSLSGRAAEQIDEHGARVATAGKALTRYADDFAAAKRLMGQAAATARAARLHVTDRVIADPGSPPAIGSDLAEQLEYADRVRAFRKAANLVRRARIQLEEAQTRLKATLKVLGKYSFNALDLSSGIAAAMTGVGSTYHAITKRLWTEYDNLKSFQDTKGTKVPWLDKLHQQIVRREGVSKVLNAAVRVGSNAKNFPVVGAVITTGATIYDVAVMKEDKTKSVVSNYGGYVAGTLATIGTVALVGASSGVLIPAAVIGFGVSTGTDYLIEKAFD